MARNSNQRAEVKHEEKKVGRRREKTKERRKTKETVGGERIENIGEGEVEDREVEEN